MRPKKIVVRTVYYGCCDVEHRHRSKDIALRCMAKQEASKEQIRQYAEQHGPESACSPFSKRMAEMRLCRQVGMTYLAIGKRFGISQERVRQVICASERKARRHEKASNGVNVSELRELAINRGLLALR